MNLKMVGNERGGELQLRGFSTCFFDRGRLFELSSHSILLLRGILDLLRLLLLLQGWLGMLLQQLPAWRYYDSWCQMGQPLKGDEDSKAHIMLRYAFLCRFQ